MTFNAVNAVKGIEKLLFLPLFLLSLFAFSGGHALASTIKPTAKQIYFHEWGYGYFIHYSISVHNHGELFGDYETLYGPTTYHPSDPSLPLVKFNNVEEWVRTAVEAGAKYLIFTTKHVNGFCLWDCTEEDVPNNDLAPLWGDHNNSPYNSVAAINGDKKDLVDEFVKAARKFEIPFGFYYAPGDHNYNSYPGDALDVFLNPNRIAHEWYPAYVRVAVRHWLDLASKYPDAAYWWLDGAGNPFGLNSHQRDPGFCGFLESGGCIPALDPFDCGDACDDLIAYKGMHPLEAMQAVVKKYNKSAIVLEGWDREAVWDSNPDGIEAGVARYPAPNVRKQSDAFYFGAGKVFRDSDAVLGGYVGQTLSGDTKHWTSRAAVHPTLAGWVSLIYDTSVCYSLHAWMWWWGLPFGSNLYCQPDRRTQLYFENSVGTGSNVELNLTPNSDGQLDIIERQYALLYGNDIKKYFGYLLKPDLVTETAMDAYNSWKEIEFNSAVKVKLIELREADLLAKGETVSAYRLYGCNGCTDIEQTQYEIASPNIAKPNLGATIGALRYHRLTTPASYTRIRVVAAVRIEAEAHKINFTLKAYADAKQGYEGSDMTGNLALAQPSFQSSTFLHDHVTFDAAQTNDGNTGTISATNDELQPWWEVKFDNVKHINRVELHNRTDLFGYLNRDIKIEILDSDGTWIMAESPVQPVEPGLIRTLINFQNLIPVVLYSRTWYIQTNGSQVRIQLDGTSSLSLAEVKVFGVDLSSCGNGTVEKYEQCDDRNSDAGDGCNQCLWELKNLSIGGTASQTSTQVANMTVASKAIDGFKDGNVIHPSAITGDATVKTESCEGTVGPDDRTVGPDDKCIAWELTLEKNSNVHEVKLFNRYDVPDPDNSVSGKLADFNILLIDDGGTVLEEYHHPGAVGNMVSTIGHPLLGWKEGRTTGVKTVRIEKIIRGGTGSSDDYLPLDEVEIWGETSGTPTAICQDITVPTDPGVCTAAVDPMQIDNGSSDPDGDDLTKTLAPPGPYDLGMTAVELTVKDPGGLSDTCSATVTVEDAEAPTIDILTATPDRLWPPNHKMVPVTITAVASDNCEPNPVCILTAVTSNEPDGSPPDWQFIGDLAVNLRAERLGTGSGRVYTNEVTCSDSAGNMTTDTVEVFVPHGRRR